MKIFGKPLTGKIITFTDVAENTTIRELKINYLTATYSEYTDAELEEIVDGKRLRFIFSGKELENGRTIKDYNIQNESAIQIVDQLNAPKKQLPLVEKLQGIVSANPSDIAVVNNGEETSYAELNTKVNQLANYLIARQLDGAIIGIKGQSKYQMLIAQLAVLKINGTFVILDEADAPQRQVYIRENANIKAILNCQSSVIESSSDLIQLNFDDAQSLHCENPLYEPAEINPAYILYTSGSTGNEPKGVIQTQQGIIEQIEHYTRDMGIQTSDILLQLATMGHDQAIVDIYAALLNGATLVLSNVKAEVGEVIKTIKREKVTVFSSIPALFTFYFQDTRKGDFPHLRLWTIGGDTSRLEHARLFQKIASHPDAKLINGYGATECSWVSCYAIDLSTNLSDLTVFPLGSVTQGIEYRIHNKDAQSNVGELLISGSAVSPGYWNNQTANKDSFVFLNDRTYYKTGDIVIKNNSGCLFFQGRRKYFEKIRGKRVNLTEIADQISRATSGAKVVVVTMGGGMSKKLIAYIEGDEAQFEARKEALEIAVGELPDYMIPNEIIHIPAFPLLANGKIDRNRLKNRGISETAAPSPSVEIEIKEYGEMEAYIQQEFFNFLEMQCEIKNTLLDVPFNQLGGDSLSAMFLMDNIHQFSVKKYEIFLTYPAANVLVLSCNELKRTIISLLKQYVKTTSKAEYKLSEPTIFSSIELPGKTIPAHFVAVDYKSMVMNFEAMKIIIESYNQKYGISIFPCESNTHFLEMIQQYMSIPADQWPVHNGLTLPRDHVREAHPSACIFYIDEKGNKSLLILDSTNTVSPHHIKNWLRDNNLTDIRLLMDPLSWRKDAINFSQQLTGNISEQKIAEATSRAQLDETSCSVYTILTLKNMLKAKVISDVKTDEKGVITYLPPEAYKAWQKELPYDVKTTHLKNKDKTLASHQEKHTKMVTYDIYSVTPIGDIKTGSMITASNTYLFHKSMKFKEILDEHERTNSSSSGTITRSDRKRRVIKQTLIQDDSSSPVLRRLGT